MIRDILDVIFIVSIVVLFTFTTKQSIIIEDLQFRSVYYGCATFSNNELSKVKFNNE